MYIGSNTYLSRCMALARCTAGITALEFALVAPFVLFVVMGIIEVSLIMFTSNVMEGATNASARLGKTGYVADGLTREQAIIDSVTSRTAGLLDPEQISISTEVYSDFEDIGEPEPCISPPSAPCPGTSGVNFTDINGNGQWDSDMGAAGLGDAGDVVVYTVSYPWQITTPLFHPFFGNTYTITARTVVRNEPYD